MSKRRVVITGLGAVTPLGNDVASTWNQLIAGQSGIATISKFDASAISSQIAGEVKNFDVSEYIGQKEARTMDTFIHYGLAAGIQAFRDSGINVTEENAERIGVIIGSGIGGLPLIETNCESLFSKGPRRVSPFLIPGSIINMISGHMSIMYGLKGPNLAVVTACTTGTHCIGEAMRMIQYGDADAMLAGGAESTISALAMAGFANMRALSTRNDEPARASRPWDADRDGFVMGEGAGVLMLEEYEHAKARGAKIYAELAGYGMSADANHMTAPCEDGDGAMRSMRNAMRDAGVNPDQVNYINAHGTSTPLGDVAETVAIKRALGDAAKNAIVNSTKSMTGHLLGAAGAIETIVMAMAIETGNVHPTINLTHPDPELDLDYVTEGARDLKVNYALSNSFGFGGHNASLLVRRYED